MLMVGAVGNLQSQNPGIPAQPQTRTWGKGAFPDWAGVTRHLATPLAAWGRRHVAHDSRLLTSCPLQVLCGSVPGLVVVLLGWLLGWLQQRWQVCMGDLSEQGCSARAIQPCADGCRPHVLQHMPAGRTDQICTCPSVQAASQQPPAPTDPPQPGWRWRSPPSARSWRRQQLAHGQAAAAAAAMAAAQMMLQRRSRRRRRRRRKGACPLPPRRADGTQRCWRTMRRSRRTHGPCRGGGTRSWRNRWRWVLHGGVEGGGCCL